MTCSTSYCLVNLKDLWNVYMYVCVYVILQLPTKWAIFLPSVPLTVTIKYAHTVIYAQIYILWKEVK